MSSRRTVVLFIFIVFAIMNLEILPALPIESSSENASNDVIIAIKTGDKIDRTIPVSSATAEQLKDELLKLQSKIEAHKITEKEYLEQFINLFKKQGLLPKEITLELFQQIAEILQGKSSSTSFDESLQKFGLKETSLFENNPAKIPIHIGKATIIGSIRFGNYLVRRVIPFKPYVFDEIFSKELFLNYNLSSCFTYASACIWIPGPQGHHVLYSFIPYPGLQSFSQKIFLDKSIGGIFLIGANISLEAFSEDGKNVLFDATIGVYGSDIMIGF
jgi:hypothetical protein